MRVLFHRPEEPDTVVGSATWRSGTVEIDADDEGVRRGIRRIFRAAPVRIDDPSMRSYGTAGPVVLAPGSLKWFRAAAVGRSEPEGFAVRFLPVSGGPMGWDPAGAYRTFDDAIQRMARLGERSDERSPEAGKAPAPRP